MENSEIKAVQGIAQVYDSKEARSLKNHEHYPIAWEVLFVNNSVGKEFASNAIKAFERLPKKRGVIMDFQGEHNDVARCLECAFADKDSFRKILNEVFNGISFYHEEERKLIPKPMMLAAADKVLSQKMALSNSMYK